MTTEVLTPRQGRVIPSKRWPVEDRLLLVLALVVLFAATGILHALTQGAIT